MTTEISHRLNSMNQKPQLLSPSKVEGGPLLMNSFSKLFSIINYAKCWGTEELSRVTVWHDRHCSISRGLESGLQRGPQRRGQLTAL